MNTQQIHGRKIIHQFSIPREGWEMDNIGWVTRDESGKIELWTTNHGGPPCAYDQKEFADDMQSIAKALVGMQEAKRLLESQSTNHLTDQK